MMNDEWRLIDFFIIFHSAFSIRYMKRYFIFFLLLTFLPLSRALGQEPNHSYPRTANYFLHWTLSDAQARELSKWDLLVLDMEVQVKRPDLLRKIREWNPDVIMLAYIAPQEIEIGAATSASVMRQKLVSGIPDSWYVANTRGERLGSWPGTKLLNVTDASPRVNGEQWRDYLVRFASKEILGSGLWDGIFYDNAWDSVTWFVGNDIDLDRNGARDANPDAAWQTGMRFIYEESRRATGDRYFIVGNGTSRVYSNLLNGAMFENFIPVGWARTMETYKYSESVNHNAVLNIINANTGNFGQETDYRRMRFGLASALMEDGYYSFDYGDTDHGQLWRYDEYDIDLGQPVNGAIARAPKTAYAPDVWTREFDHGIAVVNATGEARVVELPGEYEKIRGTQDTKVNDGTIVSETTLDGYDGQMLLKTFAKLDDVLVPNGSFVRFFHPDGGRARNGFFILEDGYKTGDQVGRIDIDGNGQRDLVVVSDGRISAWRDDGIRLFALFPYSANYGGELRVAVGNLNETPELEIIVAPPHGYALPIKIYGAYGEILQESWFPFGAKYKGGYAVAIGNVDGVGSSEIIIGAGKDSSPTVALFTNERKKIREWFSYEKQFKGGVSVAAGDVNGNGADEIIVSPGSGGKPFVKIFDGKGKLAYKQFGAYGAFGFPGLSVAVLDVDFDGKKEIVGVSKDIGN